MWVMNSKLSIGLILLGACSSFSTGPELSRAGLAGECSDGVDNDGNGLVDYPADPGCESELDPREEPSATAPACADGIDNDGDGRIDFDHNHDGVRGATDDPGCTSAADQNEYNVVLPQCSDGVDNDADGLTDFPADPQCSSRNDDNEAN